MELKNKIICYLGDSITQFNYYVTSVNNEFKPKKFINAGLWGTRIAKQKSPTISYPYKDKDYISRVGDLDKASNLVIVYGGTNDFDHGDAPLGKIGDKTAWTFYGALEVLIKKLHTQCPKAKFIFITPTKNINQDSKFGENKKKASGTMSDYVNAIINVCGKHDIPVINLFTVPELDPRDPQLKAKYFIDDEHPTHLGHDIIASKLIALIKKL